MAEARIGRDGPSADLIVVGGGVIGLACAWRAALAGLRTIVVDAGPAERASEVAAGMIAPIGEASWGEENLLAAGVASAAAWPAFAAELEEAAGLAVPYRSCGALHVALDRDELAELRRVHELHLRLGLDATWRRGSECRALEPGLAPSVAGGFDVPGEAEVDPRATVLALRAAAAAAGVDFIDGQRVTGLLSRGEARRRREPCGRVVDRRAAGAPRHRRPRRRAAQLGAGADSGSARSRARSSGSGHGRGSAPASGSSGPSASTSSHARATRWWSGPPPRSAASTCASPRAASTSCFARPIAPSPRSPSSSWSSARSDCGPGTPDNAPVIGATDTEGLLVAGGHYRNGILLAPFTATAIVALLTGAEPPAEAAALTPARFERRLQEARA